MAVFNNILNGASGQAGGAGAGYQIERSLRFEGNTTTPYLSKNDYAADSNRQTFTLSLWVKKSATVSNQRLFGLSGTNQFSVMFSGTDQLSFYANLSTGTAGFDSAAKYRDFSAWYHIVLAFDTTASGADKMKVYVNGEEPSFTSISQPADNATFYWGDSTLSHFIGRYSSGSSYFYNGYMADIHYVDGQQLNQYDFGEFDANGVWQPIKYAGTYGTNGFHLDFSDIFNNIGGDSSGNGNDWTTNNIALPTPETDYGDVSQYNVTPGNTGLELFTYSEWAGHVNFSTGAITTGNWLGTWVGTTVLRWTPTSPIPITSSLDVYGGAYINAATNYTVKVRFTDATEQTVSGTTNTSQWVSRLQATGVSGKSIEYVETTAGSYAMLCGVRVDGVFLERTEFSLGDACSDSPTNGTQEDTGAGGEVSGNYATFSPYMKGGSLTLSEGNLTATGSPTVTGAVHTTIAFDSGKWYAEYEFTATDQTHQMGLAKLGDDLGYLGSSGNKGVGWEPYQDRRYFQGAATTSLFGQTYTSGTHILGLAVDMDAGTADIYVDGTLLGQLASGLSGSYFFAWADIHSSGSLPVTINLGQRPWAYQAPTGHKALCTANLDDPTILDGSTEMDASLYSGTGSAQPITGLNFAPDLVWGKKRNGSASHVLMDTIRGNGVYLRSDTIDSDTSNTNVITSFNSDGFTLGTSSALNTNGGTYVAWAWKGGGTAVSNTNGTITSSVSANPSAGFSVVTYTGNGVTSTVGHGLGAKPGLILLKTRSVAGQNWYIYHSALGATKGLFFNTTAATTASYFWNDTEPTSSVFTADATYANSNQNNATYVAYCFAPVEGYSAFGSLDPSSEPFIYTGFRPKFLLYKLSNTTGPWVIYDTERNPYNVADLYLQANSNATETTLAAWDFLSNGFKIKASFPSGTIVYAAFAEHPFKTARAR